MRDTIKQGLIQGQWDLKMGENLYIKTDEGLPSLPDSIEFSERLELYRRGILQPPQPREIELNAQIITEKTVRVRWKARGALTVRLWQDESEIPCLFRPSDDYETTINQDTVFRAIADYGNGEIEEKSVTVKLSKGVREKIGGYEVGETTVIPVVKPTQFEKEGTVNSTFKVSSMISNCGLFNKVFTLDALHCIQETTQTIIDSQNDYLITVKANQSALYNCLKMIAKIDKL